jgi:hypothetical protein
MTTPRNIQSGEPVAESSFDTQPRVASAAEPEGTHYEADPDQIVKVSHQVKPESLPPDTETDYEARGGPQAEAMTDVRVTPTDGSVREARAKDD